MPMAPPPEFSRLSLTDIAAMAGERRLPPVASWNPDHCGNSEMRIAADGRWFHQEAPIARPEMVALFASILRREPDGGYVLVTPAEKLTITVDDLPFLAVSMKSEGEGPDRRIAFRLASGETLIASALHPLRFEDGPDGPRPSLLVRPGLEARIARPVFYDLAEIALAEDGAGLWSDGAYFAMAAP